MLKFWRSRKSADGSQRSQSRQSTAAPSGSPARTTPPDDDQKGNATAKRRTSTQALQGLGFIIRSDGDEEARPLSGVSSDDARRQNRDSKSAGLSTRAGNDSSPSRASGFEAGREKEGRALRTLNGTGPASTSHLSVADPQHNSHDRSVSPAASIPASSIADPIHTRNVSFASNLDAGTEGEDRDPAQIYAPMTWAEMVSPDLVANLSARERTRQEILWEVVASEERYVAELRSLVDHYVYPLLHPHLSSHPSIRPALSPRPSSSHTLSPYPSSPPTSSSSAELPIASRFSRSPSPQPEVVPPPPQAGLNAIDFAGRSPSQDDGNKRRRTSLGRSSYLDLPTGARRTSSPLSLEPIASNASGSRIASSLGSRVRYSLRPASSSRQLRGSESRAEEATVVPPLPTALRAALQATSDMLQGHEDLSARLKEQWIKAFPLVRGMAAIWSDQPWFLHTYTTYVLHLEEALALLDTHLSAATEALEQASRKKLFKSNRPRGDFATIQLGLFVRKLEEQAAAAGESNLGICLSKPLMRLSKLPLLTQALLYHTDPTTHEWEKTRAMALEVDALVRSIENEKLDQLDREQARDALARIDGIRDQALMAPRGARVLLDEKPAPPLPSGRKDASRRLSTSKAKRALRNGHQDWLIVFTDVVVRAEKVGETGIPGSFSRGNEKKGRQGKLRKTGKLRNTYRFIGIERWETPDAAEEALAAYYERRRLEGATTDAEDSNSISELDAESQMSFRYDGDEPQPVRRSFRRPTEPRATAAHARNPSPTKFAGRLRDHARAMSPDLTSPGRHYDTPTVSSMLKAQQRATAGPAAPPSPPSTPAARRNLEDKPQSARPVSLARDESTFGLYSIWASSQATT